MGEQCRPAAASRSSDLLSLGSFVVLGLPDGMLGTAWPSMRATFGAPVGALGLILLIATAGSVLVTAFVGPLIRRLGVPALLAVAGSVAALGYTGFALAPGLWLILAVAVLLGMAAGMMDAGLNTAVALTGRSRLLNLLHGAYGVGTAIGPLVVTAAILTGSWRPAYLLQLTLDLLLAVLWLRHRQRDRAQSGVTAAAQDPASEPHPAATWSRRRYGGVVVAGMSVFFVYTGLEVGAGQWEASYCRGHLNLSPGATGLAVFGYWGALTAVRIGLAVLPRPVPPQAVVRWGNVLAVLAAAAVWWQPDTAVAITGFVVLGGALAGVFPALISLTPVRLGEQRAHNVISWQVGAAAAGGAGISAVIGLLIGVTSLAILGPAMTVLALIVVAAELILHRLSPPTHHRVQLPPEDGFGHEPDRFGQLYVSAMTSAVVTRRRVISIGWVVVFAFLLGLTIWLASSANGSSGTGTSPSPTGTSGSPVPSSSPAAQASGPDTWVVISALGTAAAGIGALVSGVAAVSAVRVAARQTPAVAAAPAPVVRKRKKRR